MLDQLVSKPLSLIRALGTKKGHPCRGSVNRTPSILHPSRPPSLPPILPSLLLPFSLCQVRRWPGPGFLTCTMGGGWRRAMPIFPSGGRCRGPLDRP